MDGVDVREMTQKDVRDRIGYVPQKGVLFSGTIDSNIRYGKTEISEDAVKKAARVWDYLIRRSVISVERK